jgi:hypothetical protein
MQTTMWIDIMLQVTQKMLATLLKWSFYLIKNIVRPIKILQK